MATRDRRLIARIQRIRARNNGHWMDLMRLAFELAPQRAREILQKIVASDRQVQALSRRLAKGR